MRLIYMSLCVAFMSVCFNEVLKNGSLFVDKPNLIASVAPAGILFSSVKKQRKVIGAGTPINIDLRKKELSNYEKQR